MPRDCHNPGGEAEEVPAKTQGGVVRNSTQRRPLLTGDAFKKPVHRPIVVGYGPTMRPSTTGPTGELAAT